MACHTHATLGTQQHSTVVLVILALISFDYSIHWAGAMDDDDSILATVRWRTHNDEIAMLRCAICDGSRRALNLFFFTLLPLSVCTFRMGCSCTKNGIGVGKWANDGWLLSGESRIAKVVEADGSLKKDARMDAGGTGKELGAQRGQLWFDCMFNPCSMYKYQEQWRIQRNKKETLKMTMSDIKVDPRNELSFAMRDKYTVSKMNRND